MQCVLLNCPSQSAELNSCWNSVYRRVFNFRKYDSVRTCICGPGRLDFQHLRTFSSLVFIEKGFYSSNNVVRCMARLFSVSDEFHLLCTIVGVTPHRIDATPIYALRCSVYKNSALMTAAVRFPKPEVILSQPWIEISHQNLVCISMFTFLNESSH